MSVRDDAPTQIPPGDLLLAALAYLSLFLGLWLIAPLAVYLVRREGSRFVAHHAAAAALLHLAAVPLGVAALGMSALLGVGLLSFALGALGHPTFAAFAVFGAWLGPILVCLLVTVWPAIRAARGHMGLTSPVGRMAASLVALDRGVPPAPGA
jgi:hypothetical protein